MLTQIGIIVGLGVLPDTLLVRTVLVPAIVQVLNNRFWAPGQLSRSPARKVTEPVTTEVNQSSVKVGPLASLPFTKGSGEPPPSPGGCRAATGRPAALPSAVV